MKASSSLSSIFDRLKHCSPVHASCLPRSPRTRRAYGGMGGGTRTLRTSEPPQLANVVSIAEAPSDSHCVNKSSPSRDSDNHQYQPKNANEHVKFIDREGHAGMTWNNIFKNTGMRKKYNRRGSRSLDGSVCGGTRSKSKKEQSGTISPSPSIKKGVSTSDVVQIGFYDDDGFIRSAFRFDPFHHY